MPKNRLNKLENWRVTLLPNPKRHSQAKALGLCGGFAVGCSEAQSNSRAQWWYQGIPREVTFPSQKQTGVRGAQGDRIAGWWENGTGSKKGAAVWHMQSDGTLTRPGFTPCSLCVDMCTRYRRWRGCRVWSAKKQSRYIAAPAGTALAGGWHSD